MSQYILEVRWHVFGTLDLPFRESLGDLHSWGSPGIHGWLPWFTGIAVPYIEPLISAPLRRRSSEHSTFERSYLSTPSSGRFHLFHFINPRLFYV